MTVHPRTYKNWSENLSNSVDVIYPKSDKQIIRLINSAKEHGKVIRVVGNSHASSPMVSGYEEPLVLISLAKYKLSPKDFDLDPDAMIVTVNAGWKLAQLYERLNEGLYFLETQTASTAFSVGGIIGTPVHGGRLGASLMADTIIGLTLINGEGQIISKSITDSDFEYYRLGLGVLGIITSVTFRIHQMLDVQATIKEFPDMFKLTEAGAKLNRRVLKNFFWERISYCLTDSENSVDRFSTDPINKSKTKKVKEEKEEEPEVEQDETSESVPLDEDDDSNISAQVLKKRARYCHCFLDFHNNLLMSLDWTELDKVRKFRIDGKETMVIPKVSNWFHQKFFTNYRQKKLYLKMMGKFVRANIKNAVVMNRMDDQDMMWVGIGTRVYFMSYYIPIYTEGEKFKWSRLAKPLEIIMNTIRKFQEEKRTFAVDFPVDMRFVTSSPHTRASPIYSEEARTVYLGIDLTAGPGNIYLTHSPEELKARTRGSQKKREFVKKLNADFRDFYENIEQTWRECGGIPHWGKLFGFQQENLRDPGPFNSEMVRQLIPEEVKQYYRDNGSEVFANKFVAKILKEPKKPRVAREMKSLADVLDLLNETSSS